MQQQEVWHNRVLPEYTPDETFLGNNKGKREEVGGREEALLLGLDFRNDVDFYNTGTLSGGVQFISHLTKLTRILSCVKNAACVAYNPYNLVFVKIAPHKAK